MFKQARERWLQHKERKLESVFKPELDKKREEIKKQDGELEVIRWKNQHLKEELEKSNLDLREQIVKIEAKARPDSVWITAFTEGHSKAWDFLSKIFADDVVKAKVMIHDMAVDETIKGLDSTIKERLEQLGKTQLKPINEIVVALACIKTCLHRPPRILSVDEPTEPAEAVTVALCL